MRPLPAAVASGSLSSLLISFVREAFRGDPLLDRVVDSCPITPLVEFIDPHWRIDWFSFTVGCLVGLLVGPVIDLLFVLRHQWLRFFRLQIRGLGRSVSYRVLE